MSSKAHTPDAARVSVALTAVALGASACGLAWVLLFAFVPLLSTGT